MTRENRRKYTLNKSLKINGIIVNEVIIDPHVDKHEDHINDDLILSLVELLDGKSYKPASIKYGFSYYVSKVLLDTNVYRLVWLQQDSHFYIGVITSFKDKGGSHDVP